MQKIRTENNKDGKPIIYVQKCSKFNNREWKTRKNCENLK